MRWLDFAVRADFSWPNRAVEIPFEGKFVMLRPDTDELLCTASLYDDAGTTFDTGGTILSRFLSRLAWSREGGIEVLFAIGTNQTDQPGRLGRGTYGLSGWASVEPWHYLYLPLPASMQADLALALFREGLSLNSDPLAFLSFFKILNVTLSNGPAQMAWLNSNLHHITGGRELDRLNELRGLHADLGNYLYVQGRCAVAHANASPIAHPDFYSDKRRLHDDLPLIQSLAAIYIEQELGVLSNSGFLQAQRHSDLTSPEILFPRAPRNGRVRYGPYQQYIIKGVSDDFFQE